MKKVVIIHTSFVSVDDLKKRFARIVPEVCVNHIVDDSLLEEVSANGKITPRIIERMTSYFLNARLIGADLVFNQCSSVRFAARIAALNVDIPMISIDEVMAENAVGLGRKIALIATVGSTIDPSQKLLEDKAIQHGLNVVVTPYLVDGALEFLMGGDREKHNRLVIEKIKSIEDDNDVIVLAQGSMVALIPLLNDIKKPVLSSPELGVQKVREILGL
ncbi:MAG TPA: Asp/Glu/hydantoin racemase [Erysipelotrichaceae bacterium]|nr:Asp/Glu/hydantoin racemase [Erysipelotrichaceae bacterium]